VVASTTAGTDAEGARRLGNASIGMSIAGIVVTIIIVVVAVAVTVSAAASAASSCNYTYYGFCWKYKTYVGSSGYCSGVKSGSYCYHD